VIFHFVRNILCALALLARNNIARQNLPDRQNGNSDTPFTSHPSSVLPCAGNSIAFRMALFSSTPVRQHKGQERLLAGRWHRLRSLRVVLRLHIQFNKPCSKDVKQQTQGRRKTAFFHSHRNFSSMCANARIDLDGNAISMAGINEVSVEYTDIFYRFF
jgi:hypothetical protein